MAVAEFDMKDDEKKKNSNLADLRGEIDRVDDEILKAVSARFKLTAKIAQEKEDGYIFRPGREADVLRRLLAENADKLDPRLVENLWRGIIAFSIAGQKTLTIALSRGDAIAASARYRFGEEAQYLIYDSSSDALGCVASGAADLGVMPHWDDKDNKDNQNNKIDDPWLQDLADLRKEGSGIAIASLTPFVAGSSHYRSVVIAPHMPDKSANDITLCYEKGHPVPVPGHHPEKPGALGIFQQH